MSEKFLRDIEGSIKEQPPKEEKKEGKEKEIQRLKLDPEKNIDIVIIKKGEKGTGREALDPWAWLDRGGPYFPVQVLIEKNGKVVEDFGERVPDGIFATVRGGG